MKHKLIEKIVRIFNEGQDTFHIFLDNAGTGDGILWIKDCGTKLYADVIKARDLPIHGFLVNHKYGFFEAYKKYYKVITGHSLGVGVCQLLESFANAVDKDAWVEENLWVGKKYLPYAYEEIKSEEDIAIVANKLYSTGRYPAGMSDCWVVGINGDCGPNCPVFLRGECEEEEEIKKGMEEST